MSDYNIEDYRTVVCVCGGRYYENKDRIRECLAKWRAGRWSDIIFITGECKTGADKHAKDIITKEFDLPYKGFPADWNAFVKSAGPIRNSEMSDVLTHCIAFWDGKIENSGTFDMIKKAIKSGADVTIFNSTF